MHSEIALVDFSSVAHPIWHQSGAEPDPNHCSQQIIAKIHLLTGPHAHCALCFDQGRSFRKDLSPSYKQNRPEHDAALQHQIALARETLIGEGYPCWGLDTFEGDDIISAATVRALALDPDISVLIITADKDLVQLVEPRVRVQSPASGRVLDESAAISLYGVTPAQMVDYLALVGDTADNIKGAQGIGPKGAALLLTTCGTIEGVYQLIDKGPGADETISPVFKPAMLKSLAEFRPRVAEVKSLIQLRTDVPIPFEEIAAERPVPGLTPEPGIIMDETASLRVGNPPEMRPSTAEAFEATGTPPGVRIQVAEPSHRTKEAQALVAAANGGNGHSAVDVMPAPAEWGMQLEPRSMSDARVLASDMFASRLFSAYGTPAGILATVMAGRELGMQAMASLRAFHIVEGRPTMAADVLRALVIRSGKAKYFRCTERTATRATFETQRGDDPPISLSYTIEEAIASGRVKEGSGYKKDPADILVARSSSKLVRLVYSDVIHGLYSEEEF